MTLIICLVTNGSVHFAFGKGVYKAELSGSNEVPPVTTSATGVANFKFNVTDGIPALNYQVNVTNMSGITGAHVHIRMEGNSGPVVATLFAGPATGKVNGLLAKGAVKSTDLQGPLKGHPLNDLLSHLDQHRGYVNVHTQEHQGGEIRGQMIPTM